MNDSGTHPLGQTEYVLVRNSRALRSLAEDPGSLSAYLYFPRHPRRVSSWYKKYDILY